jgi:phosphatidate cytidylyltransferase
MKIDSKNRSLVNIVGAPLIVFSIMYNHYSFYTLIFCITIFSFYEYINLIKSKSQLTFLKLLLGFLWISSIGLFIPLYQSILIPKEFILIIFSSVWITDSAAYVMGKKFGKKKIFPSVSANKTWVGSISGLVFSILFLLVIYLNFGKVYWPQYNFQLINVLFIGFITGLFSQFGDFLESYFKRSLDVKDSSNLLLGHGGFLDRFDSMYAVSFATYFYLLLTGYYG